MGKRFYDVLYSTFSIWSEMVVVCPVCGRAGTVHFDQKRQVALFQCRSCGLKKETVPSGRRPCEVTAQCSATGRYFRAFLPRDRVHGQKARVQCPCCGEWTVGEVSVPGGRQAVVFEEIRHAEDPYFHLPLYFQAGYRGKTIWALNREHLQYLIDYLSAQLRTVRPGFHKTCRTMRAQSDQLPTFMKTAKNRNKIVRLLRKLQAK